MRDKKIMPGTVAVAISWFAYRGIVYLQGGGWAPREDRGGLEPEGEPGEGHEDERQA